ncbi:MAG: hypothetical protein AUH85_14340 [Chloroflexi bacterium 13_1_40CM_4_68_4]|nr:MAG: hypothetical protein AUH85_14340 [Chloroflexi bacterium 13_1_40CM_4_68_4]
MRDALIALLLGIATSMTRLPFVAQRLWEWDSVLYARALENGFHVEVALAGSRPHPPGYIFYVASAAFARSAGLDSDHALVLVSIVASGIGAAALYLLCRRLIGAVSASLVTIAFAASPNFWLHGEVAISYVLLAPLVTILAMAFLWARGRGSARAVFVSLFFGLLAGFRQDVLLFLTPLWLWLLVPASARERVAATAALAAGCLSWFVPSALLSDGPVAYVANVWRQFSGLGVSAGSPVSLAVSAVLVLDSLWWSLLALGPVLIVLALARGLARLRGSRTPHADHPGGIFFALWLMPPLLFYLLVHIGEWGYVLSLVPGLYALLAWLLRPIIAVAPAPWRAAGGLLLLANALVGAGLFVLGDDPVFSTASLAGHDRATDAKTQYLRDTLPASSTIVLASVELLVARYYLPDRTILYSDDRATGTYTRTAPAGATLVVYEAHARPLDPPAFDTVEIAPGIQLEIGHASGTTLSLHGRDADELRR